MAHFFFTFAQTYHWIFYNLNIKIKRQMKKLLSILAILSACIAVLFAATKSEMRMHVHLRDAEKAWTTAVKEILTISFQDAKEDATPNGRMNVYHSSDATNGHFAVDSIDSVRFQRDVVKYDVVRDGALIAASFKVSDKRSVYFSQGNLQYNAGVGNHATADGETAKGTWRFAENQYDYIGLNNIHTSEAYDGWVDLFGWGTSGWNSEAEAYQPWSVSETETDYTPKGDANLNLSEATANADWGVYNAISNGGDQPNLWRTLSADEWRYLFAHNSWTLAKIGNDSTLCLLLFPNEFEAPTNIKIKMLSNGAEQKTSFEDEDYSDNFYTVEEFAELEGAGAIALPPSGRRIGEKYIATAYGHYWSNSAKGEKRAGRVQFLHTSVNPNDSTYRNYGLAVRLVYDLNFEIVFKNHDGSIVSDTIVSRGEIPTCASPKREDVGQYRYTFKGWDKEIQPTTSDMVYTAIYDSFLISKDNGKLFRAVYKVSDTKEVYFSQGNLQCNVVQRKWRFAENQYDIVGSANSSIAQDYDGWIDLFGWSTSGYPIDGKAYDPWSTSTDASLYGPDGNNSLTGDHNRSDWAYYNRIANGGDCILTWRTLTNEEWQYLIQHNDWTMAKVGPNNTLCLLLIPKDFKSVGDVSISKISGAKFADNTFKFSEESYSQNVFNEEQFKKLEEAGVVAFPCAGSRIGSQTFEATAGTYWSTTANNDNNSAYCFGFNSSTAATSVCPRYAGLSVRPVYELNFAAKFVNYDGTPLYTVTVKRNEMPVYKGETPTKDGLLEYDYTFKCWNKTILPLREDVVYTAVFDSVLSVKKKGVMTRNAVKVSDTKAVYFSQGNLQFNAATHDWRFASLQYESLGTQNDNAKEDYDGYIDLFGWGTSGWNSGATAYLPWSTSTEDGDYIDVESLTDEYEKADWAIHNTFSNGSGEADWYRMLTKEEWDYALTHNKWTLGKVGDDKVLCLMFFPSDFEKVDGLTVKMLSDNVSDSNVEISEDDYADNVYSLSDFQKLEEAGAVALPTTGTRTGTTTSGVNEYGLYWTTTSQDGKYPYEFGFTSKLVGLKSDFKWYGLAVRPVHELNVEVKFVDYDGTLLDSLLLNYGDSVAYTGATPKRLNDYDYIYTFDGWDKELAPAHRDIVYTAKYMAEKRKHVAFKVSDDKYVYFSTGNLQYNAGDGSTHTTADGQTLQGTWRFADQQYEVIGSENANISETYDGWIDLFGWGTSGYPARSQNKYRPWDTHANNSFYQIGGTYNNQLINDYKYSDWGVYNSISNGGNVPNKWRVLTSKEWDGLREYNKWTMGYIITQDGVSTLCMFLIPNDFTSPSDITVEDIEVDDKTDITLTKYWEIESFPSSNIYTTEQFKELERLGVVALPCAGYRDEYSVNDTNTSGYYWSVSGHDWNGSYGLYFNTSFLDYFNSIERHWGCSVRLVQDK